MMNSHADAKHTRGFSLFLRCLAALMVFAQLSAAAAICPDYDAGRANPHHACGQEFGSHHADGDEMCASDFVPANQIAAIDPVIEVPGLVSTLTIAALWPLAPSVQTPPPQQDAAPIAPVPRYLVFGRLLN